MTYVTILPCSEKLIFARSDLFSHILPHILSINRLFRTNANNISLLLMHTSLLMYSQYKCSTYTYTNPYTVGVLLRHTLLLTYIVNPHTKVHLHSVDPQKNRRNYLITRSILKFPTPRRSSKSHYSTILLIYT